MTRTDGNGKAGRIVLVASGKGGAGKSTFTVNCGAALAQRGKKVLLVDADIGLRSLDLMFALSDRVIYDFGDVLCGRCEPAQAVLSAGYPNLFLLPAPQNELSQASGAFAVHSLLREFAKHYDFVLVDSPAGVGPGVKAPAGAAGLAIVVAMPDPVGIRDAERTVQVLVAQGVPKIRLVINRVDAALIRKRILPDLDTVIDGVSAQLLGVVPEDPRVLTAAAAGKPVTVLKRGASTAFSNIAARLDGEEVPLMKL